MTEEEAPAEYGQGTGRVGAVELAKPSDGSADVACQGPAFTAVDREQESWFHVVAVAFGFASIFLTTLAAPVVGPHLEASYHWSGSASTLFGPVILLFALVWICTSLFLFSARALGRWRVAVWSGLLLSLPWIGFRIAILLWGDFVPLWVHFPRFVAAIAIWLLLVFLWRPVQAPRTERIIHFASTALIYMGLSGAVVLAVVLHAWWGARNLNHSLPLHPQTGSAVSEPGRPRIIWIVLDELSYDQVFGHRFPGLRLPALDAFAAQSTVFTHVIPAGNKTDLVMPGLFTGTAVDRIRSTPDGQLLMRSPKDGRWTAFQQHATVFQDALNDAYRTGLSGWYNPYCRIMPAVLFHCAWSFSNGLVNGLVSTGTFRSNLLGLSSTLLGNGPLRKLFGTLSLVPPVIPQSSGQIADYRTLYAAGDRLLTDSSSNFVLIHMPVPHPPGYYNRFTGQLTSGRSYVDNLALADRYLAHVHSVLQQRGEWAPSIVLVMGDHSWRTNSLWRGAEGWTAEDERAVRGGQFDDRPAYLIKLGDQKSGQTIDVPFRALNTRKLLDALLMKRLQSAKDLRDWVGQVQ